TSASPAIARIRQTSIPSPRAPSKSSLDARGFLHFAVRTPVPTEPSCTPRAVNSSRRLGCCRPTGLLTRAAPGIALIPYTVPDNLLTAAIPHIRPPGVAALEVDRTFWEQVLSRAPEVVLMLKIHIRNESQNITIDATGVLEIDRGPKGEAPRFQVDDPTVSRDQMRVQEVPDGRIRLENLSTSRPIVLNERRAIPPGSVHTLTLPVSLTMGTTRIDLS